MKLLIVKWFTVVDISYAGSNVFTTTEENEAALSLFCELGISSQDQFCLEIEVNLGRKKEKQIFLKTPRDSKLTWQKTLQINNAYLDRSRCWQHLQEAKKKTFSITVSWQKQIKLCVSSQKGELLQISTFSFKSLMLKLTRKLKLFYHVWK